MMYQEEITRGVDLTEPEKQTLFNLVKKFVRIVEYKGTDKTYKLLKSALWRQIREVFNAHHDPRSIRNLQNCWNHMKNEAFNYDIFKLMWAIVEPATAPPADAPIPQEYQKIKDLLKDPVDNGDDQDVFDYLLQNEDFAEAEHLREPMRASQQVTINEVLPSRSGQNTFMTLESGQNILIPLRSGPNTSMPLKSGQNTLIPLRSGPNTSIPFKSGPNTLTPLKSGPNTLTPLNSGPNTLVPFKIKPSTLVPLKNGSLTLIPFKSEPSTLTPLKIGPNTSKPLGSGPNTSIPLRSPRVTSVTSSNRPDTLVLSSKGSDTSVSCGNGPNASGSSGNKSGTLMPFSTAFGNRITASQSSTKSTIYVPMAIVKDQNHEKRDENNRSVKNTGSNADQIGCQNKDPNVTVQNSEIIVISDEECDEDKNDANNNNNLELSRRKRKRSCETEQEKDNSKRSKMVTDYLIHKSNVEQRRLQGQLEIARMGAKAIGKPMLPPPFYPFV